jgi:Ca2+-binding RTX toxin-like protein
MDQIQVDGGAGDDVIEIKGKLGATVWGGDGNDSIKGGDGDDVLLGGAGNDTIEGRKGNDVIVGGEGTDKLIGGDGKDVLIAGELSDAFFATAREFYFATSREEALRKLGDDWVASRVNSDLADNNSDQDVLDEVFDTLSGGSGADWFIVNHGDKISDVNLSKLIDGVTKDGDLVTFV